MIDKINAWRDDFSEKRKERDAHMKEKTDQWAAIRRDKRANWFANNVVSRKKQYTVLAIALGVIFFALKK